MKRKNGFYWVKRFAISWEEPEKWTVAEYENGKWIFGKWCYEDSDFAKIDEHEIEQRAKTK